MTNWETVEVPRGAYIGWGEYVGQHVTGYICEFDPVGGTDFNGNVCPSAAIELTEPAASFDKAGTRTDFPAGELVQLNAGQVSLKRAFKAANPAPGDMVKITLDNLAAAEKGTVKEFGIKIARGARPARPVESFAGAAPQAAPAAPFAAPAAGSPFGAPQAAPAAPAPQAAPFAPAQGAANPFAPAQTSAQPPF